MKMWRKLNKHREKCENFKEKLKINISPSPLLFITFFLKTNKFLFSISRDFSLCLLNIHLTFLPCFFGPHDKVIALFKFKYICDLGDVGKFIFQFFFSNLEIFPIFITFFQNFYIFWIFHDFFEFFLNRYIFPHSQKRANFQQKSGKKLRKI